MEIPELMTVRESSPNENISIYPNPVTGNQFNVQFSLVEAGTYSIQVTDARGTLVSQKIVAVSGKGYANTSVALNATNAKGLYIVKITDANSKLVYSNKIVVQ